MAKSAWRYSLALGLVLLAVWLLWSGHYGAFLVGVGVASTGFVVLVGRRMGVVDREGVPAGLTLRAAAYVPWLAWELIKANLDVARRILHPRLPIRPHLIRVEAGQRTDLGRVIYANSITLTPGTVSVDMEGGSITVHALTDEAAAGVLEGAMDRRVQRVEGRQ